MRLVKVDEFAKKMGLSPSKVYTMCYRGELPSIKMGGWRIDEEMAEKVIHEKITERFYAKNKKTSSHSFAEMVDERMRQAKREMMANGSC